MRQIDLLVLEELQHLVGLVLLEEIGCINFLERPAFFRCRMLVLKGGFEALVHSEHLDDWRDVVFIDSGADVQERDEEVELDAELDDLQI
jgi:hypothetical protein